jgi:predicted ferric reductase
METWFPWVDQAWDRHKTLVKAVWFTVGLFAICIYRLWRWRHRNVFAFWTSICTLFLLHVLGVLFYTTVVQPILGWQWIILLVLEVFLIVFLVDWSTKRFRHLEEGRREHEF